MYQPHPVFRSPDHPSLKVWRYMDFPKFVAMLAHGALHFCRVAQFDDPFEGSYTASTIAEEARWLTEIANRPDMKPSETAQFMHILSSMPNRRKWDRENGAAINCWHANEHESAAMWALYLSTKEGIAVQSTFERLCNSFEKAQFPVFVGMVNYIDYEKDSFPLGNTFQPFLHKRKSFEHEKEVRAIISHTVTVPDGSPTPPVEPQNVEINLETLIEHVHISPQAPEWFHQVVTTTITRFGYSFVIKHSDLAKDPLY
jgi:hypothetical protein